MQSLLKNGLNLSMRIQAIKPEVLRQLLFSISFWPLDLCSTKYRCMQILKLLEENKVQPVLTHDNWPLICKKILEGTPHFPTPFSNKTGAQPTTILWQTGSDRILTIAKLSSREDTGTPDWTKNAACLCSSNSNRSTGANRVLRGGLRVWASMIGDILKAT